MAGHLMETSQRIAAEEAKAGAQEGPEAAAAAADVMATTLPVEPPAREVGMCDLPGVAQWVLYHPRNTEVRRGRRVVPGLVIWRDLDARTLELCLVHEANDVRQQENVREWPGGEERGWEPMGPQVTVNHAHAEVATVRAEIAALRDIVLGDYADPPKSVLDLVDDLDNRIDALSARNGLKPTDKAAKVKKPAKKARKGR